MVVVVTAPPLIAVVPAASVVTLRSGLVPPTGPPKVVVPESFTVRLCAVTGESTVEEKVTPTPVKVVSVPRVTAPV